MKFRYPVFSFLKDITYTNIKSSSSGRQLVHGNTQVPQLLVLGIVGYPIGKESSCSVSARVFLYLLEIREACISVAVELTDLALIDDINVSWFII